MRSPVRLGYSCAQEAAKNKLSFGRIYANVDGSTAWKQLPVKMSARQFMAPHYCSKFSGM